MSAETNLSPSSHARPADPDATTFEVHVRDDSFSAEFAGTITATGVGAQEMVASLTKAMRQLTEFASLLVEAAKNEKASRGS